MMEKVVSMWFQKLDLREAEETIVEDILLDVDASGIVGSHSGGRRKL